MESNINRQTQATKLGFTFRKKTIQLEFLGNQTENEEQGEKYEIRVTR